MHTASQTEEDRTLLPQATLPANAHVVCPGRVMSSVLLLPKEAGRGTCAVDVKRVTPAGLATEGAASRLQAVVERVVKRGLHPVIIGDRWSACAPFLARMTNVAASQMPLAGHTPSRLFTCRPCSPVPSAWGQSQECMHAR